jgi:hypothetical protein
MLRHQWVALAAVIVLASTVRSADDGFVGLVQGDDPKQFELVGIEPDTIQIDGGEIRVSGRPDGYFATRESYKNYVLTFEWMYERPDALKNDARFMGNSGLLLHIEGPHKVWPKCIEAQLMNADAGHLIVVSGAKFHGTKDAAAQKRAIKPVGEWNQQEVTCQDGAISCKINGVEVSSGTGGMPDHGQIGWQSEGAPIRFRNLKIKKRD